MYEKHPNLCSIFTVFMAYAMDTTIDVKMRLKLLCCALTQLIPWSTWEGNSLSAALEILRHLWNAQFHYHVNKILLLKLSWKNEYSTQSHSDFFNSVSINTITCLESQKFRCLALTRMSVNSKIETIYTTLNSLDMACLGRRSYYRFTFHFLNF